MHPLIDGILAASRARGFEAAAPWPKEERRDLIASARALKSRGIIPIIAEIKPKALGRTLTPEEVAAYARAYSENNACAISVLTEPTHFQGRSGKRPDRPESRASGLEKGLHLRGEAAMQRCRPTWCCS